jgi:ABC-type Na+ efflux pump permease subunit
MAISNLQLIVRKTWQDLFKGKQNLLITITVLLFCMLSIGIGFTKYTDSFSKIKEYRKKSGNTGNTDLISTHTVWLIMAIWFSESGIH